MWNDRKQELLVQNQRQGKSARSASTYDRVAGGTSHWLGTCLRFVPSDFKMKTLYGKSVPEFVDWPIDYDDLVEWYRQGRDRDRRFRGMWPTRAILDIKFPSDYNYPMPAIPTFADRSRHRQMRLQTSTRRRRRFLGWRRRRQASGPRLAGGAQLAALSKPPRLRRQHQLHSDLPDPGQIRSHHLAERRAEPQDMCDDEPHGRAARSSSMRDSQRQARSTTSATALSREQGRRTDIDQGEDLSSSPPTRSRHRGCLLMSTKGRRTPDGVANFSRNGRQAPDGPSLLCGLGTAAAERQASSFRIADR